MNRTRMSYMVPTIVSFAALGALTMQPTLVMALPQQFTNTASTDPTTTTPTTTNPACGQVVAGNVTLTSNLNCGGDGLIVGADHTRINLNGYSIDGPGKDSSKVGIMIPATDDVEIVGPGALRNFQAGVLMTGAHHVKVSTLIAEDNQIAMFMTGTRDTTLSENIMKRNTIAMAAHSASGIDVESNLLTGNALAGVTLVNSFGSNIATNIIQGATNGIFIDPQSHDNAINSNTALKNVQDINNANGLPTNINHNDFADNNCQTATPSGMCKGT